MSGEVITRTEVGNLVILEEDLERAPECETCYQLFPVPAGCHDVAKFTVRFKPHGCGRGTQLACASCVEFYMTQPLACVWCHPEPTPLEVAGITSL